MNVGINKMGNYQPMLMMVIHLLTHPYYDSQRMTKV